jgi:cytochrome c oxidase subunit I
LILGLVQLIFIVNFFYSLFRGQVAGRNPWHANTLEWTTTSPAPHGNFPDLPVVYRGPYEYGAVNGDTDHLPQDSKYDGVLTGSMAPVH